MRAASAVAAGGLGARAVPEHGLGEDGAVSQAEAGRPCSWQGEQREQMTSLSRVRLFGPTDGSAPGSSVHGVLQARTLEWADMPSSRGSS